MVNSIEQLRARSRASSLRPKDLKLTIVVNYIPAGLARALKGYAGKPSPKNTFAAISTVIKKRSTIETPRRYPLEGFLGSVFMDVDRYGITGIQ